MNLTHTHTLPYTVGGFDDIAGGFHTEDDREGSSSHIQQTRLKRVEESIYPNKV